MSLSLGSDNHSGVHPKVLAALAAANQGHAHSYGMDDISKRAQLEWDRALGRAAPVFYVFNGTAANVLALQSLVRPYEAVICSEHGHLHGDECGAPEKQIGCKLYPLPSTDGRIFPEQTADLLRRGGDQHFASPKAVSLTLPTELGVCYSLQELRDWRKWTRERRLFLHWDGARLANAAAHHRISIADLVAAGEPDAISFGGTKNGLMGAEAVVLFQAEAGQNFKFIRKQGMQLSSKTRFLAAQFEAYFQNDLWREIADHTTGEAKHLAERLRDVPEIQLPHPVQSNALFPILPEAWIQPLLKQFFFYIWDHDRNMARWMISWDWRRSDTEQLLNTISEVKKRCPA